MDFIGLGIAFVAGGVVGATVGYTWLHKQLASAQADLNSVVTKFAPAVVAAHAVTAPPASAAAVTAAVAASKVA
jgi:hypothetical protein